MVRRSLNLALVIIVHAAIMPGAIRGEERVSAVWDRAEARGRLNRESLRRVDRVLRAWLGRINAETGMPPERYEGKSVWTVANAAADLYSSLVMDAAFVDRDAMEHTLKRAVATEREHAERIGHLPDDLDLHTLEFVHPEPSLARCQYGASEWCRDGLLRITEILGPDTPWFERMAELVNEIMVRADVPSRFGPLPGNIEVCGEMLQTLSRLHAITGEERYRTWAERIGDYYLFENPPHRLPRLRLRDHGGEIISGLAELFAMTSRADPAKAARYQEPLREMLDRVLEIGQMPDGMLANIINPRDGEVISVGIRNARKGTNTNWGYTCNAHCTYDMVTGGNRYGGRIEKALAALPKHYRDDERFQDKVWYGSSDYFADFLENAMVLYSRYPVEGVEPWIADTIPRMWAFQNDDGTVNRHYHDGSFGRTSVLFARLCSRGVRAEPWREDLCLGAAQHEGRLYLWLHADRPWSGRLIFDFPRWREALRLPVNYPRINELTEWYVVSGSAAYRVILNAGKPRGLAGQELIDGLPLRLERPGEARIIVGPIRPSAPPIEADAHGVSPAPSSDAGAEL
jgi:hypothetical protein